MKQEHKEKWVEGVLNSADKIQHVQVPDGLFEQIEQATAMSSKRVQLISLRTVSIAASSIALLVFANLYFITNKYEHPKVSKTGIESVVEFYGLQEQNLNYGI